MHDKDTQEDGTPKKPHWHIELKLYKSRRRSDVASWFGLAESCIQDSKSGKYENMFLYLIHKNAPEKHQYSPEDFEKKTFPRNRTDLPDILDAMGLKKYDPYLMCRKLQGKREQDQKRIDFLED